MSKLILPNEVKELIVPTRRKFLYGTATTMAALFAGPAIVRASSLMDINSLQNRLVMAYTYADCDTGQPEWMQSMLNVGDCMRYPDFVAAWQVNHGDGFRRYDIIRRADILPYDQGFIGGHGYPLSDPEAVAHVKQVMAESLERFKQGRF